MCLSAYELLEEMKVLVGPGARSDRKATNTLAGKQDTTPRVFPITTNSPKSLLIERQTALSCAACGLDMASRQHISAAGSSRIRHMAARPQVSTAKGLSAVIVRRLAPARHNHRRKRA